VVVDGQYRLQPGSKIRLVDPPPRGQAPGQPTSDAAPPPSPASSAAPAAAPSGQAAPLASGERPRERGPRDPNNPDAPRRHRPPTDQPTDDAATPRPAREPS
jgi:membrane fusion protein, multidrug efflux system